MTRAEFAAMALEVWKPKMRDGESLLDVSVRMSTAARCRDVEIAYLRAIADVATNGFDPEPIEMLVKPGVYDVILQRKDEAAQESAKRSRPFVGSHKLPFDSDWD